MSASGTAPRCSHADESKSSRRNTAAVNVRVPAQNLFLNKSFVLVCLALLVLGPDVASASMVNTTSTEGETTTWWTETSAAFTTTAPTSAATTRETSAPFTTTPAPTDQVVCAAGEYLNVSSCVTCPSGTISLAGSDAITDCICNIGFEAQSNGISCTECAMGTYKAVNGSGMCMHCLAGQYLDSTGGSVCLTCPTNKISPMGSGAMADCICDVGTEPSSTADCTACALGTYKAKNGSDSCMPCGPGEFQNTTGGSVCRSCPSNSNSPEQSTDITACVCNAGFEGPAGAMCTACAMGTYKEASGAGMCMECAPGTYLNRTMGMTPCLSCPSGTISLARSDDITDCICNIGFEGQSDGVACTPCAEGVYKGRNGTGICTNCAAGTYPDPNGGPTCMTCPANTYSSPGSDEITDCICNIGFQAQSDGVACQACAMGTYKAKNGSGTCMNCPAGQYLNMTGGSMCRGCPSNTISPMGSGDITDCICNVGYQGSDGAACTPCIRGTYKLTNGSGVCTDCAPGTYLNQSHGSACLHCPPNTMSLLGSDDISDCMCDIGFEGSGSACTPCSIGTYKAVSGPGSCRNCAAGTYLNRTMGSACMSCPSGTYSLNMSSQITDCICNIGFEAGSDGMACSACALGTFKATNGSGACANCPAGNYQDGTAGSACRTCSSGTYLPGAGGTVCLACQTNAISPSGSVRFADCSCNSGFSLLFDQSCSVLSPPTVAITSGTLNGNNYVGMARVGFTRQANSNLTVTTGNNSLTCAGATSTVNSIVVRRSTTVKARSCGLEGSSSLREFTVSIIPGATVTFTFSLPNGFTVTVQFLRGCRRRFAILLNLPEDQIEVTTSDGATARRLLQSQTVSASAVASDQSQFTALTESASTVDTNTLNSIVQEAAGDTTLTASGLQTEVVEGPLTAATTTTTPVPDDDDDDNVGAIVGGVLGGLAGLGLLAFIGYQATRGAQPVTTPTADKADVVYPDQYQQQQYQPQYQARDTEMQMAEAPGMTASNVFNEAMPGFAPVYTPDPNYPPDPAHADLAFVPPMFGGMEYSMNPGLRQYVEPGSAAPMYQPNYYQQSGPPNLYSSQQPSLYSSQNQPQLYPMGGVGFPSGQPFQI